MGAVVPPLEPCYCRKRRLPDDKLCAPKQQMRPEALPFELVERQAGGAVRLGLSLDKLLADSFIERHHGDARDQVTPVQYLLLCVNTMMGVEDAGHGLARVGLVPAYPIVGLRMALTYHSLGEALEGLSKFYALASSGIRIKLSCYRATAVLSVSIDAWTEQDGAHVEETYLGWLYMKCLHYLGHAPPVSHVTLRNPTHFDIGGCHWATGGMVSYGSITSFAFPRRLLASPPASERGLHSYWDCHQRWLGLGRYAVRPCKVSDYVNEAGIVRFSDLVKASGQSANTLRHHFQEAGGSYRETRRQSLVAAATDRLRDTRDSVETIATSCGFSDARAFRRFLKNATGLTPHQFRTGSTQVSQHNEARARYRLEELTTSFSI